MRVHLVDGTYELFRQHFGMASRHSGRGPLRCGGRRGGVDAGPGRGRRHAHRRGVRSHDRELPQRPVARLQDLEGMDPEILEQIPVMERALAAAGFTVWPMVEHEADDALAAAAGRRSRRAGRTGADRHPDKDLGQCVRGDRVVQFDRRKREIIDADGVRAKFGVGPESIPDYLGLVGDTADGFPGLPGWGAKSAALVLARYGHIEDIPPPPASGTCPGCAARPSCRPPCRRNSPTHCCSGGSPRSTPTSTSARSTTGAGRARPTTSRDRRPNSTPPTSSPTPTRLAPHCSTGRPKRDSRRRLR
jgi:hypothetical protein